MNALKSKRGISLIAVLMFMLAATTASIIIFRWIGSENFASGARLKSSEAYQASESGIDATRSWLANRTLDVGLLIKQYFKNKRPIDITAEDGINVLAKMTGNKQQNFKVYLVGVDTLDLITNKNNPIKLKFLSQGIARDSSQVSQTAVFSVKGLYRIYQDRISRSEAPSPPAYFGSSMDYGGANEISSAYINGDWSGNPPKATKDWVVTGSVKLSGNDFKVGGNTCVGKNLSLQNAKDESGGVYVGGKFCAANGSFSNVYVEGNDYAQAACNDALVPNAANPFTVRENLTVMAGRINHTAAHNFKVGGNLVMGPTAGLRIWPGSTSGLFKVEGNVWIPNSSGIETNNSIGNYFHILGDKSNSILAVNNISKGNPEQNGAYYNYIQNSATFKSKASSYMNADNEPIFSGANKVKEECLKIFGDPEDGCNGEPFVIDDMLKTQISEFSKKAANKNCDGINDPMQFSGSAADIKNLNKCYEEKKSSLYNEFLVINMKGAQNMTQNSGELLNGKFIFVFEDKVPATQFRLPAMYEKSMVLAYLKEGTSAMLQPSTCNASAYYNYFIYSLKPIPEINGFLVQCPFRGTVYTPVRNEDGSLNCANTVTKIQSNTNMVYNEELIKELNKRSIICDPKDPSCNNPDYDPESCKPPECEPPTSHKPEPIKDDYWIPTASRLFVKLENKELSKESYRPENIIQSTIVMPRIIRIKTNELGDGNHLDKYYSCVPFNGDGTNKNECGTAVPQCDGGFVYNGNNEEGDYRCTFGDNSNISDFYVIVKGERGATQIRINGDNKDVSYGGDDDCSNVTVYLDGDPSNTCDNVSVRIDDYQNVSSHWKITPFESSSIEQQNISFNGKASVKVYKICIDSPQADYIKVILDGGSCDVSGDNFFTISKNLELIPIDLRPATDQNSEIPNCESEETAGKGLTFNDNGYKCNQPDTDSKPYGIYECPENSNVNFNTSRTESCEVLDRDGPVAGGINVIVPPVGPNGEIETVIKYASAKLKPHTLTVKMQDASNRITFTASTPNGPMTQLTQTCEAAECSLTLYHGLEYEIANDKAVKKFIFNGATLNTRSIVLTSDATLDVIPANESGCNYEPEWCNGVALENVIINSTVMTAQNGGNNPSPKCYFVSAISATTQNIYGSTGGKAVSVNGVSVIADAYKYKSNVSWPEKEDGGYYVYLPPQGMFEVGTTAANSLSQECGALISSSSSAADVSSSSEAASSSSSEAAAGSPSCDRSNQATRYTVGQDVPPPNVSCGGGIRGDADFVGSTNNDAIPGLLNVGAWNIGNASTFNAPGSIAVYLRSIYCDGVKKDLSPYIKCGGNFDIEDAGGTSCSGTLTMPAGGWNGGSNPSGVGTEGCFTIACANSGAPLYCLIPGGATVKIDGSAVTSGVNLGACSNSVGKTIEISGQGVICSGGW